MKYRPEIDGLRAVAVIPVILFHAGLAGFSGGFVGVDVFFVISGYLITTILYNEISDGTFSILNFYDRRVRRLLPALFFVCLFCCIFAWLWMLPDEFLRFGRSLIAVNIYASNILFWKEVGYFTAGVELKPLLHTWSLAVEEQFYLVFPLILLALRKLVLKRLLIVVLLLVIASFALCVWASYAQPRENFYWLPMRAWEMGVGSVLALTVAHWSQRTGWLAEAGALLGLVLIIAPVIFYDGTISFPGVWALPPVLGCALIIAFARTDSIIGRFLGAAPIRGIGLISYSAYLWHWPLFVFARIYYYQEEAPTSVYLALSALSLFMAYISWRYIEQPFRNRTRFTRKSVFLGAGVISACFIGFGAMANITNGLPMRHPNPTLAASLDDKLAANHGLGVFCNPPDFGTKTCQTSETPEVLVWGDSYAMHLSDAFIAAREDIALVQMTKSVCGPFFDLAPILGANYNRKWAEGCAKFNSSVQQYLENTPAIKYVILSSPFGQYSNESQTVLDKGQIVTADRAYNIARFKDTLGWLNSHNIKPIVVSPPPKNNKNNATCLARSIWFRKDLEDCQIRLEDYQETEANRILFLREIERTYDVVWPSDYLCDGDICRTNIGDIFIYRDGGHFSREGAKLLGKNMDFNDLLRP